MEMYAQQQSAADGNRWTDSFWLAIICGQQRKLPLFISSPISGIVVSLSEWEVTQQKQLQAFKLHATSIVRAVVKRQGITLDLRSGKGTTADHLNSTKNRSVGC